MTDNANTANIKANTVNVLARSAEAGRNSATAHRENTATGAAETGAAAADSSLSAEVIRTTGIGTPLGAGAILTRITAIILRIGTLTTVAPYQDSDSMGPDPSWFPVPALHLRSTLLETLRFHPIPNLRPNRKLRPTTAADAITAQNPQPRREDAHANKAYRNICQLIDAGVT